MDLILREQSRRRTTQDRRRAGLPEPEPAESAVKRANRYGKAYDSNGNNIPVPEKSGKCDSRTAASRRSYGPVAAHNPNPVETWPAARWGPVGVGNSTANGIAKAMGSRIWGEQSQPGCAELGITIPPGSRNGLPEKPRLQDSHHLLCGGVAGLGAAAHKCRTSAGFGRIVVEALRDFRVEKAERRLAVLHVFSHSADLYMWWLGYTELGRTLGDTVTSGYRR